MQLGTRWNVGGDIPPRLPEVIQLAVQAVEDDLSAQDVDTVDWRWTLTWLESSPVLELDDGTTITYDPNANEAVIAQPEPDDSDDDDQFYDEEVEEEVEDEL